MGLVPMSPKTMPKDLITFRIYWDVSSATDFDANGPSGDKKSGFNPWIDPARASYKLVCLIILL